MKFLQGEKVEQEIAEGCKRLIKNAIICWNYLFTTQREYDFSDKWAKLAPVSS